eukprot:5178810-Pleurochrysis_carterae.AAC.2
MSVTEEMRGGKEARRGGGGEGRGSGFDEIDTHTSAELSFAGVSALFEALHELDVDALETMRGDEVEAHMHLRCAMLAR